MAPEFWYIMGGLVFGLFCWVFGYWEGFGAGSDFVLKKHKDRLREKNERGARRHTREES